MENKENIKFSNGSEIEVLKPIDNTRNRGRMSEIFWKLDDDEYDIENDEIK